MGREIRGFMGSMQFYTIKGTVFSDSLEKNIDHFGVTPNGRVQTKTSCQLIPLHFIEKTLNIKSGIEITSGNIDTNGSFSLSWEQPENHKNLPKFYRSVNNGAWTEITKFERHNSGSGYYTDYSFKEYGLVAGRYRYKVSQCSAGFCEYTNTVSVKVDLRPPAVQIAIPSEILSTPVTSISISDYKFYS